MKPIHYTEKYLLMPTHPVTVNLIGCGGTGSQVLTTLARIDHALFKFGHPGLHVVVYDPDEVTEANLGRQLFSQPDLGLNKANVLVTRNNRFFGLSWVSMPVVFERKVHSGANITITCVDNVKSRVSYNEHFKDVRVQQNDQEQEYYWLDFGNGRNTGQIVLGSCEIEQPEVDGKVAINKLPTVAQYFDLTQINEKESGPSCSLAEALSKQDLFINSTLAQLGGALLWKLLSTGSIDYRGVYLNLETMNVNPIKL